MEGVTWGIPSRHYNPPIGGVSLDFVNNIFQLVHSLSFVVGVHVLVFSPKVPPLESINRSQVTFNNNNNYYY